MVQPHTNTNGEETPLFIAVVIGTRPQIIKCALLIPELKKHFKTILINTGQHYDFNMNDIFFQELNLKCDYNLGTTDRVEMERRLIEILKNKPDALIVIGDTDSTFVGAMAACKLGIKLIHIEAGLRSYNKSMPEEINRVCVDHLSDVLFAPTKTAMKNLRKEGLKGYLIGDLQTDVQLHFANNSQSK